MAFLNFVLLLVALLGSLVVCEPNEICQSRPTGVFSSTSVTCGTGVNGVRIEIPGNLDLTLLPEDMRTLFLSSGKDGLIANDFQPLPARKRLTGVRVSNFHGDAAAPLFPLAALLAHNKDRILQLYVDNVKLIQLTREDFSGFARLQEIFFLSVQLETIAVDVFDELGVLPGGNLQPAYQPELVDIMISENKLKELDWGFFKPIVKSITWVQLPNNEINSKTLTCSRPFKFEQPVVVGLGGNHLSSVPPAFYETLSRNVTHRISLQNQKPTFCPNSKGCECCQLQDYMHWLRDREQIQGKMMCGSERPFLEYLYVELRADTDLHKHCPLWKSPRPVPDAEDWSYVA